MDPVTNTDIKLFLGSSSVVSLYSYGGKTASVWCFELFHTGIFCLSSTSFKEVLKEGTIIKLLEVGTE